MLLVCPLRAVSALASAPGWPGRVASITSSCVTVDRLKLRRRGLSTGSPPASRWPFQPIPSAVGCSQAGRRPAYRPVAVSRSTIGVRSAAGPCGVGENEFVKTIAASLRDFPQPARWAIVGAASVDVIGAIAGLVIGLHAYAPTAPFAVIELGLPAAIVGGLVGLGASVIATTGRRIKGNDARSP